MKNLFRLLPGIFRRFAFGDGSFEGRTISIMGPAYTEGLLDFDKKVIKMIEFYELLHSKGDWCAYNLKKNEKGIWVGEYNQIREEKPFDSGKLEIISLRNIFSLDKGVDNLAKISIFRNGPLPKKLAEFWNGLKEQGFNVPQEYFFENEGKEIEEDLGEDLLF